MRITTSKGGGGRGNRVDMNYAAHLVIYKLLDLSIILKHIINASEQRERDVRFPRGRREIGLRIGGEGAVIKYGMTQ